MVILLKGRIISIVKVEVVTKTTYVIDLPIESFSEIETDKMSLSQSDKMVIKFLEEKLHVGVDEIASIKEVKR